MKVDPELPFEIAALFGCAVLTGVGAAVNAARIEPGERVAVFGLGGVGLSALLGAVLAGAGTIVAVDVVADKLELARELGATDAVAAGPGAVAAIRELTGGGADHAIETVGSAAVLAEAYDGDAARRHDDDGRPARPEPDARASPPSRSSPRSGRCAAPTSARASPPATCRASSTSTGGAASTSSGCSPTASPSTRSTRASTGSPAARPCARPSSSTESGVRPLQTAAVRGKIVACTTTSATAAPSAPPSRSSPPTSASAPSTSSSPTSTARSASTSARSACGCTVATATSPGSAPAARTCSSSTSARTRSGPAATPGSTTSRCSTRPARSSAGRSAASPRPSTPIQGASDHGISEAIYLPDPDGNGIELAADRGREHWGDLRDPTTIGPRPLDLQDLVAAVAGEEPAEHADRDLVVGHLHLHVGDVADALAFYRDLVGFEVMTDFGSAAFVAAGGYHHHLGLNVWKGEGVPPNPPDAVGLEHWTVIVDCERSRRSAQRFEAAGVEVADDGDGIRVVDPWGAATSFQPPA